MNAQQLIGRLHELEHAVGRPLSLAEFCARAGVGSSTVYRHFPGGWRQLREFAGLPERSARPPKRFSDAELLEPIIGFYSRHRRMPKWREVEKLLPASAATYQRRFGRIDRLQRAFIDHLQAKLASRVANTPPPTEADRNADPRREAISDTQSPRRPNVGPYPGP